MGRAVEAKLRLSTASKALMKTRGVLRREIHMLRMERRSALAALSANCSTTESGAAVSGETPRADSDDLTGL